MVYELIDKYYFQQPELKQILLTHSEQVRDRALRIAHQHPELSIDIPFVEEAAMLHDIGIYLCNAPKIFCMGNHHYIEHGYLGAQLLRKEGLSRHARVAERHTGVGLTCCEIEAINHQISGDAHNPLPIVDLRPETIEEELICYADKFYSKTHLNEEIPVAKVRETIWRYGHDSVLRFETLQKKFSEG